MDALPVLENECSECGGKGGFGAFGHYVEGCGWDVCYGCDGSGYIPTEAGKAILELMRHQLAGKADISLLFRGAGG